MIPLRDNIPTLRFAWVTAIFIAINVAVFAWQFTLPNDEASTQALAELGVSEADQAVLTYGAIPARVTNPGAECAVGVNLGGGGEPEAAVVCEGTPEYREAQELATQGAPFEKLPEAVWWFTILSSMFMHGGFLHLAGNMLFLWVFGNNIEDSMGKVKFVAFYLLGGIAAVYAHAIFDTASAVPMIGASGAVSAVLGAYILLHPRAKVLTLIFLVFFVTLIEIPAMALLGIWFVLQLLPAIGAPTDITGGDGVAYLAHVGGFLFGLATVYLFVRRDRRGPKGGDMQFERHDYGPLARR